MHLERRHFSNFQRIPVITKVKVQNKEPNNRGKALERNYDVPVSILKSWEVIQTFSQGF